jgi:hypothetical protein
LNRDTINPERTDQEARECEQASADGNASWLGLASRLRIQYIESLVCVGMVLGCMMEVQNCRHVMEKPSTWGKRMSVLSVGGYFF